MRRRMACCILAILVLLGAVPASAAPARPELAAESAIVMDFDTGEVLYEKDADSLRVPASMTKMMTAYIIFEELEAGRLTLDTLVPVSKNAAEKSTDPEYPSMVPLHAGEKVSVDTLLKLIMLPSASASCIVMAEYISGSEEKFVQRMNETAALLGMTTAYENCHGAQPHTTTARSQALMVRAFINRFPQILEYTSMTEVEFQGKTYANTNKLLTQYEYEGCDGFKTGTIPEAGYCLAATAVRDGHRLIAVIMKSSDDEHRFSDAAAALDYGFVCLAERSVYFNDIAGHWARGAIEELAGTGAALHVLNGAFRPDEEITRGEFTALLLTAMAPLGLLDGRTAGPVPDYADLTGCWGEAEIRRAVSLGLVTGSGDGFFQPDAPITREQAMVILANACQLPEAEGPVFADQAAVSDWAADGVARATAAGLFAGDENGRLNPQASLTRAEAAVVVNAVLDMGE